MTYVEWSYFGNQRQEVLYCCFAKTSIVKGRMGIGSTIRETLPPDATAFGFAFKNGFTGRVFWSLEDSDRNPLITFSVSGDDNLLTLDEEHAASAHRSMSSMGTGEPAVAASAAKQAYWGNNSNHDVRWGIQDEFNRKFYAGSLKSRGSSTVQPLPISSNLAVGFGVSDFKGRLVLLLSGCPTSGMTACMIADDELP